MNADAKKTVLRMIPYGIYVLTALWHQFVWRDRLLQRMWSEAEPRARGRS